MPEGRIQGYQQKTTLLASVLISTYQTCSLLQVICKENFCKSCKLGRFLADCLAVGLATFALGLQFSLPKTYTQLANDVISHLQDMLQDML